MTAFNFKSLSMSDPTFSDIDFKVKWLGSELSLRVFGTTFRVWLGLRCKIWMVVMRSEIDHFVQFERIGG